MIVRLSFLVLLALSSGCATNVPVAVSCPPPPPAPSVLTEPVLTGQSLTERYNVMRKELQDSLLKATRGP